MRHLKYIWILLKTARLNGRDWFWANIRSYIVDEIDRHEGSPRRLRMEAIARENQRKAFKGRKP